jgi:DNA-binding LacI/PurR family transcriptional regulator
VLARRGIEMVIDRIEGRLKGDPQTLLVDVALVRRGSTAQASQSNTPAMTAGTA